MKYDKEQLVAKLGRLYRYLEKIESHPENYGCAATIRKARMLTQQIKDSLSANDCISTKWNKAVTVVKRLVYFVIMLDRLRNYFDFCQQPFYGHEYSS